MNRIPQALRKRNMQDLLDEQADAAKPKPAPPLQIQDANSRGATRASLKRTRYVASPVLHHIITNNVLQ